MSIMQEKFKAIADKIREKLGITELIKPNDFADKIDDVYAAGKKAEYDAFWDGVQDYGNRTGYSQAFSNWGSEYIRPKYKVIPKESNGVSAIFEYCKKLKKIEAKYFDFSQKETGTNNNAGYYYTFNSCNKLEEIEDIGLIPQVNYINTFAYDYKLHTIAKMGVDENTRFSNAFISCEELVNLTIDGVIGQNGFDIHWSTKLSAKSLYNIITALSTTFEGIIKLPKTAEENYNKNPPEGAPATWLELVGDGTEEHLGIRPNWTIAYA